MAIHFEEWTLYKKYFPYVLFKDFFFTEEGCDVISNKVWVKNQIQQLKFVFEIICAS